MHEYRPGWNPDGWYNPNGGIFVGDVPPTFTGEAWYWDPKKGQYIYGPRPTKPLTPATTAGTIPVMAKEVIEYTEHYGNLDSSSIAEVWYNANTLRMTVRFVHGGLYSYDEVADEIFQEFMDSDSIGRHFARVFKGTGPAGQEQWPGAKHDQNNVRYVQVEKDSEREIAFTIHYVQEKKHTVTIKAKDVAEAIAKFNEGPEDSEQPVRVTGVFIPVE